MPSYIPVHTTSLITPNPAMGITTPGYWQTSFLKELHEIDNACPNYPEVTSPDGGENISSRYFTITWTEAVPTDPDAGDFVTYSIEYSIDNGSNWSQAFDDNGDPIISISEGTTSIIWDLGAILDTTQALIRICATDSYGCSVCEESDNVFTISGGSCF